VLRERLDAPVDRMMAAFAPRFGVTGEYRLVGEAWSAEERAHGLDRSYRLILQRDDGIRRTSWSASATFPPSRRLAASK
jgi:hypothetical protein